MGIILIHQTIIFIFSMEIIIKFQKMTTDFRDNTAYGHSILHQTKDKHRQLAASLLLTSSLMNHKQKINKMRQDKQESSIGLHPTSYKELLKANKINFIQTAKNLNIEDSSHVSNIGQLKTYVKKLQEEETVKLGKQNNEVDNPECEYRILQVTNDFTVGESKRNNRKINKRKIVKGRPEMFAMIRRKKLINDLLEEQKPLKNITNHQGNSKDKISDILNKNNLLKFISAKNQKNGQANLFDNFLKTEQCEKQRSKQTKTRRSSAATIKNYQNFNYLQRSKAQWQIYENSKELSSKIPKLSLRNRRFSSSNTIE